MLNKEGCLRCLTQSSGPEPQGLWFKDLIGTSSPEIQQLSFAYSHLWLRILQLGQERRKSLRLGGTTNLVRPTWLMKIRMSNFNQSRPKTKKRILKFLITRLNLRAWCLMWGANRKKKRRWALRINIHSKAWQRWLALETMYSWTFFLKRLSLRICQVVSKWPS